MDSLELTWLTDWILDCCDTPLRSAEEVDRNYCICSRGWSVYIVGPTRLLLDSSSAIRRLKRIPVVSSTRPQQRNELGFSSFPSGLQRGPCTFTTRLQHVLNIALRRPISYTSSLECIHQRAVSMHCNTLWVHFNYGYSDWRKANKL